MPSRHAISTATVVMLVVLRLNIGWHFFHEGVKHYTDPRWSSELFLRSATGPLAPMYQAYLPDRHGLEAWLHSEAESEKNAVQGLVDQVQKDLDQRRQEFALHYNLNKTQQKQASGLTGEFQADVRKWADANREDLENHVHQWRRMLRQAATPDSEEVPFQKQRQAEKQGSLAGELAGWRAQLDSIRHDFDTSLAFILVSQQREAGPLPPPPSSLKSVDGVMTYAILAIGFCLLLGLFTRTACVAGALFLLSVVMTQPFWVSAAQPTFNQFVELFALLTLATTHVGRWGGLDYFLHHLIFGTRPPRENSHALDS